MINCKKALNYAETHKDCTALGYLKVTGFGLLIKLDEHIEFENKVRMLSRNKKLDGGK